MSETTTETTTETPAAAEAADATALEAMWNEEAAKTWGTDPAAAEAAEKVSEAAAAAPPEQPDPRAPESGATEQPAPAESPADPWAGVPQALRAQFEQQARALADLDHRYKSDLGRVNAYQRAAADAQAKAASLQARLDAATPAVKLDKWELVRADFEPIAQGVEEFVRSTLPKEVDVTSQVNARFEKYQDELLKDAVGALTGVDVDALTQSQEFGAWFKTQSQDVQQLGFSPRLRDGKALVDQYLTHKKAAQEAAKKAQQLAAKRSQQLKESTAVEGTATAGTNREAGELTYEEMWAQEAKKTWAA